MLFLFITLLKLQAQTCFTKNWTGSRVEQMNFDIFKAIDNNVDLQIGDEIGIFHGTVCDGSGVLTLAPSGGTVVASNDDVSIPEKDSFSNGLYGEM